MDVGTRNTERKGVNGEDKKGLTERQGKARFRNRGRRAKTMERRKVQRVVEASAIRKEERKRECVFVGVATSSVCQNGSQVCWPSPLKFPRK